MLQACGGSSSSSTTFDDQPAVFVEPVDASTLRDALVTGTTQSDVTQYWKCSLADGNSLYAYRLFEDGTGTETDLLNLNSQSAFTWRTNSATTMATTVNATDLEINFSSIRFDNRDAVSIVAGEGLMLDCLREGNTEVPIVVDQPANDEDLRLLNAQIPDENRPRAAKLYSRSYFIGFPAILTFETLMVPEFAGGIQLRCSDWDPVDRKSVV